MPVLNLPISNLQSPVTKTDDFLRKAIYAVPQKSHNSIYEQIALFGIVDTLVDDHQLRFKGIDFSLTPLPTQARSIGAAIESLGVDIFGGSGTLFATSFLTHCIRQVDIPRTGFSGVMLPFLEDSVLAGRVEEGCFSVNDLLLYFAVCGTGLARHIVPTGVVTSVSAPPTIKIRRFRRLIRFLFFSVKSCNPWLPKSVVYS